MVSIKKASKWAIVLGVFLLFTGIWWKMLFWQDGGLYAGHSFVWADWSLHITIASIFAYMQPSHWFLSHPLYAGVRLNYPFVVNLISGLLMRFGVPLVTAFLVPSLLFTYASLAGILRIGNQVLRSWSRAVLLLLLFCFSGGLGFLFAHPVEWSTTFTQFHDAGIEFTNTWLGMLIPQRAFLLGFPIGILILCCLAQLFFQSKPVKAWKLMLAGLAVGVLPIIHTHTFIMLIIVSAWLCLFSLKKWKSWALFGIPSGLVSILTTILFLRGTVQASTFFTFHPGWYVQTGFIDWFLFWVKNWGVFGFLALAGTIVLAKQKKKQLLVFTLAWWFLFVVANILQFQPQTWDNSKLLLWAYFGLGFPAVEFVASVWHRKRIVGKIVASVLVIAACFSGFADLVRMVPKTTSSYLMMSSSDVELSTFVRTHTKDTDVFLTADWVSNPVNMLSGRAIVLGYPGWIFNYGFPYEKRQVDIQTMYDGGDKALALLHQYHIAYVFIGDNEGKYNPNSEYYQQHFTVAFTNDSGTLYAIP